MKKPHTPNPVKNKRKKKKKKKKGSKVVAEFDNGTRYVMLFIKMPLKIELWKLKTPKMCFQFP